jgi:2-methylisocitrate lyase-like PEP mutase family enzyme
MGEMVENAGRMAQAVSIPLLSDSDQGFGNAVNVRRTVQSFIQAGVAGIHIEDQMAPKRCGFVKGKELISLEEAAGKYRAAVDAKMELDPDFVIVARCDARTAVGGGMEEVIVRLKAYKRAGVDVLYFEAPQSREEIEEVRAEVEGPLMATLAALNPLRAWKSNRNWA